VLIAATRASIPRLEATAVCEQQNWIN
jgi:hypothetical protein